MRFGLGLLSLFLAAAVLTGCSGEGKTDGKTEEKTGDTAAAGDPAAMSFANAKCPMMGGEVDPEGEFSMWSGKKIGYCCDGCKEEFEKLNDDEKAAQLAKFDKKDETKG
jgi:hypothetical protein